MFIKVVNVFLDFLKALEEFLNVKIDLFVLFLISSFKIQLKCVFSV